MLRGYLLPGKKLLHRDGNIEGDAPFSVSEVYHYFFPVGTTVLCFMVLTNIDLILVKHFFTPMEAGYYSIAQIVGKIILFLPFPASVIELLSGKIYVESISLVKWFCLNMTFSSLTWISLNYHLTTQRR